MRCICGGWGAPRACDAMAGVEAGTLRANVRRMCNRACPGQSAPAAPSILARSSTGTVASDKIRDSGPVQRRLSVLSLKGAGFARDGYPPNGWTGTATSIWPRRQRRWLTCNGAANGRKAPVPRLPTVASWRRCRRRRCTSGAACRCSPFLTRSRSWQCQCKVLHRAT